MSRNARKSTKTREKRRLKKKNGQRTQAEEMEKWPETQAPRPLRADYTGFRPGKSAWKQGNQPAATSQNRARSGSQPPEKPKKKKISLAPFGRSLSGRSRWSLHAPVAREGAQQHDYLSRVRGRVPMRKRKSPEVPDDRVAATLDCRVDTDERVAATLDCRVDARPGILNHADAGHTRMVQGMSAASLVVERRSVLRLRPGAHTLRHNSEGRRAQQRGHRRARVRGWGWERESKSARIAHASSESKIPAPRKPAPDVRFRPHLAYKLVPMYLGGMG